MLRIQIFRLQNNYGNQKYNEGVAAADNRANPNSTNYQTGYNNGVNDGRRGYYTQAQYDANYNNGYNQCNNDLGWRDVTQIVGPSDIGRNVIKGNGAKFRELGTSAKFILSPGSAWIYYGGNYYQAYRYFGNINNNMATMAYSPSDVQSILGSVGGNDFIYFIQKR